MRVRTIPLLASIFGTLLALNIFAAAGVFIRTTELQNKFAGAERRYHRAADLLIEIRSDIYASMFTFQQYLLAPMADRQMRIAGELAKLRQSSDSGLAALNAQFAASPQAQRPELQQLTTESARYWDLLHQDLNLRNASRSIAERLSEATSALTQALHATRDMDEVNAAELRQEGIELQRSHRSFGRFLLLITSLTVALGIAVSIASLKRLRGLERESEAEREKAERAEFELRRLSQQLVRAQEEERKNISRELHDEVGQLLTGLRIELGNLQRTKNDEQEMEGRIAEAKGLAEKALRSIRNLAMLLRPSMLDDQGLAPALRWQAREFSRRFEVPVMVDIEGDIEQVPSGHAVCLYRVIQEVLTNCAKHAQARHIQIMVNANESYVSAVVEDDGVGFRARQHSNGIGLLGAAERVFELRGTFFIDSEPGRGTRVNIQLPIHKTELA